jgi:hypothetical protein
MSTNSYSQRKHVLGKKDVAALRWATQRPNADEVAKISEQRRRLWSDLSSFIIERGGSISSPAHLWPVRLEVPLDSELPAKLSELGYDPVYCEQTTRIGAPVSTRQGWKTNSNNAYSLHVRDVYTLKLPK